MTWNGTHHLGAPVATGVYFARFVVTGREGQVVFSKANRMLLVREGKGRKGERKTAKGYELGSLPRSALNVLGNHPTLGRIPNWSPNRVFPVQ